MQIQYIGTMMVGLVYVKMNIHQSTLCGAKSVNSMEYGVIFKTFNGAGTISLSNGVRMEKERANNERPHIIYMRSDNRNAVYDK